MVAMWLWLLGEPETRLGRAVHAGSAHPGAAATPRPLAVVGGASCCDSAHSPPTASPSTPPTAVRVSLGFMRPPRARPGLYSPVSPRLLPTLPPGAAPRLELPDLSGDAARGPVGVVVSTQQAKGVEGVGRGGGGAAGGGDPGGGGVEPPPRGCGACGGGPQGATRSRKPGADRDKKPSADPGAEPPAVEQAAKPGADLPKPGAESGKATKEPGKPGAESEKPGAESTKPGSESDKPGAESEKARTESEKPAGETGKAGVDSEKAGAEPRGEQGAQAACASLCYSSWSRSTATTTAACATCAGRAPTCGAWRGPARCTSSSFVVAARRSTTPTAWRKSAAAAAAAGGGGVVVPGVDLSRPHRQELCGRCRGRRLSCDHTFSFKYLV
ncbi:unnamed protein product [Lampetra fluviatilis]